VGEAGKGGGRSSLTLDEAREIRRTAWKIAKKLADDRVVCHVSEIEAPLWFARSSSSISIELRTALDPLRIFDYVANRCGVST
jgi:hypothetical protein